MFFKRHKEGSPSGGKASKNEDNAAEENELGEVDTEAVDNGPIAQLVNGDDKNINEAAEALLTPMGGSEEEGVAEGVDELLIPMGGSEEEGAAEETDVLTQSVQLAEEPSGEEEQAAKAPEKVDEEAAVDEKKGGKGGLLEGIFAEEEEEEASPIDNLIASLPDTTTQELLSEAQKVTALMRQFQQ